MTMAGFVVPVVAAEIAHVACNRLEPRSTGALLSVILAPIPVTLVLQILGVEGSVLKSFGIYLLTLVTSTVCYRLSPWHPLAAYPGPVLARVSRLWAMRVCSTGQQHLVYDALHKQYGDYVRFGPNHLHIRDARAIPVVMGARNQWDRTEAYEASNPMGRVGSLMTLADATEHNRRRRVWDRAFTPAALKSYTPMLARRVSQFVACMDARAGAPLDLGDWFCLLTTDFMGDFACGGAFDLMERGGGDHDEQYHVIATEGVGLIEVIGKLPWCRAFIHYLPNPRLDRLMSYSLGIAEQRKQAGTQHKDLFYYLLGEDGAEERERLYLDKSTLASEAMLALVAGSDTTSTTLANVVFNLITNPKVFASLRAEIDSLEHNETSVVVLDGEQPLGDLKYLNAVINETLRVTPVLPCGGQRTSKGPVVIGDNVIPVGTGVQVPLWSIQRDARYFSPDPDTFWPERWLPEGPALAAARGQEFTLDQRAFIPFNFGPTNCVGRALALQELRTVIATVVRRYDVAFAPGYAAHMWTDAFRDWFILNRGQLMVVLTPRR